VLAVATAAVFGPASACGSADQAETARSGGDPLVTYSREGGIRFQSSRLAVSTEGNATVRSEGCRVRFRIGAASWKRLQRALDRTDLSTLAGEYPAASGAADVISETIVSGRYAVRIGDFTTLPAKTQRELLPLVSALGEILEQGESRCGI